MNTLTDKEMIEILGDNHQLTSSESPIRSDAFNKTNDEKMQVIEKHFFDIMHELGLDMTDDSLQGTPHRVAKMYIQEIFSGLDPKNKPKVSTFENEYQYNKMLVEANKVINFINSKYCLVISTILILKISISSLRIK